jgi:hypothetical protein
MGASKTGNPSSLMFPIFITVVFYIKLACKNTNFAYSELITPKTVG